MLLLRLTNRGKKMKPFNLEDVKAGKKVVTRDGRDAEILKYDFRTGNHSILAVLDNDGGSQTVQNYTKDGCYYDNDTDTSYDLFMASTMKSGWINIYKDMGKNITGVAIYTSEQAAVENAFPIIATIKIEWEE